MTQGLTHCSFCGKASTEVRYIVADSSSTTICNECALLTIDVLIEREDPEIAGLLERHQHLLTLDNPCVLTRDIHISNESQMPTLWFLGFLPTFLANVTSQLQAEVRLDIALNRIRLAVRTTVGDRSAIYDAIALYGDILSNERSIDEVPLTANARQLFNDLSSVCEGYTKEYKSDPSEECPVSPSQTLGWVLSEDWDEKIRDD